MDTSTLQRALRSKVRDLAALAGLALLACLVLSPTLVADKVAWGVDGLTSLPPWEEAHAGSDALGPVSDEAQRYYPWYAFLSYAAHSDQSILWNPLEGAGTPFFAAWRTRCLSVFSLPFYLFPLDTALRLSGLMKLLMAAWGMYYVARKLGFSAPLAFAASVAVQFSAYMMIWLNRPPSDVVVWMPLLILTVERLAIGQTRLWTLPCAVVVLMAAGGDPEQLAGALLLGMVYLVLRLVLGRAGGRATAESMGFYLLAIVAGVAVLSVQIIPFLELTRGAASTGRGANTATLGLRDFLTCFLPNFYGMRGGLREPDLVKLLHVGLMPLFFLPVWFSMRSFVRKPQRHRIEALLLAVAVMTALAVVREHLPLLRDLSVKDYLAGNAVAFALMAVASAEEWLLLNAEQVRVVMRRLRASSLAFLAVGLVLLLAGLGEPRPAGQGLWIQLAVLFGLGVGFFILLLVTLLRPSRDLMGYGLGGLIFLSSMWAFSPHLSFLPFERVFPVTDFVTKLKAQGGRIAGGESLRTWPLSGNLIPQIYCPSGLLLKRQNEFLQAAAKDPQLFRRAGTKSFVLTKDAIQGPFADIRPALAIQNVFSGGAVLFQDLHSEPRVQIISNFRNAAETPDAVVESHVEPVVEGTDLPPTGQSVEGKVKIASETGTGLVFDVDVSGPALLRLADAFYPGWKATVDGQPSSVLSVDRAFRGVALKEGQYQVEMHYAPRSVKLGLYISIVALVLVLAQSRHVVFLIVQHAWPAAVRD